MHSAFTASNGSEKSVPVEKQLPVYQELVRALKAEAKAIKSTRNTQAFINEILEVRFFKLFLVVSPLEQNARKNEPRADDLGS